MKKLISNSNPFILLLVPVFFALIMGVSYQLRQHSENITIKTEQATSLFSKSVGLIKTVCSVAKEKLW
jgi:exopolysaccharide biosynthesis protein